MMEERTTDSVEEVRRLRCILKDKPRHVRSMARLAVLLHHKNDDDDKGSEDEDAMDLALQATQCRPDLPYGHWALSMVSADPHERMEHLRRAADRCDGVPHILALSRLLLEPRQHEAMVLRDHHTHHKDHRDPDSKRNKNQSGDPTSLAAAAAPTSGSSTGAVGSASDEHPSRRPLSAAEEELYQQWNNRLQDLYRAVPPSSTHPTAARKELESVAEREYSVGMMFRKMIPAVLYQVRCIQHLESCSKRFRSHTHPKAALAQFWLAAIRQPGVSPTTAMGLGQPNNDGSPSIGVVTRCPPEYVVGLYSTFASRFDSLLVDKLSYRTPTLLRQLVDAALGPRSYANGLDLGCGTGLSGCAFRDCVSHKLRGVDLSPDMIETARSKRPNGYDELVVGDVTDPSTYGTTKANTDDETSYGATIWELIYACDVFVYLGDLSPVFALVSDHLHPNMGAFAFSTELLQEDSKSTSTASPPPPYKLQSTGRFAHSVSYLTELAAHHNFRVRASKIGPIRKNAGRDIVGSLMVLSKA